MKRFWMSYALASAVGLLLPMQPSWSDDEKREEKPAIRKEGEARREAEAKREGGERKDGERRETGDRPQPPKREGDVRRDGEGRPMPQPGRRDGEPRDSDFRGPGPGPGPRGREGGPHGPPDMERMKDQDPEMFALMEKDVALEHKTVEIAQKLSRATAAEKEKMKEEVKTLAGEHFAVRQQRRQLQLKRMEEDLKRLKESVDSREKQKAEIIQRRVDELLGNENDRGF